MRFQVQIRTENPLPCSRAYQATCISIGTLLATATGVVLRGSRAKPHAAVDDCLGLHRIPRHLFPNIAFLNGEGVFEDTPAKVSSYLSMEDFTSMLSARRSLNSRAELRKWMFTLLQSVEWCTR